MNRIIPVRLLPPLPLLPTSQGLGAKDLARLQALAQELQAAGLLDAPEASFEGTSLEEVERLFNEAVAVAHSEREDNPAHYNPAEEERLRRLGQGRESSFEERLQALHEDY